MSTSAVPDVYIDTDTVVYATITDLHHSIASRQAFNSLLNTDRVVHFSVILRMEYAQAIRNLATRGQLPVNLRHEFELDRWFDPAVRQHWMRHGMQQLETFISDLPTVVELPLTSTIVWRASTYMARYALRSHDAVHLATALHYQIPVFWTCDDHFRRVDDLFVEIIRDPA